MWIGVVKDPAGFADEVRVLKYMQEDRIILDPWLDVPSLSRLAYQLEVQQYRIAPERAPLNFELDPFKNLEDNLRERCPLEIGILRDGLIEELLWIRTLSDAEAVLAAKRAKKTKGKGG